MLSNYINNLRFFNNQFNNYIPIMSKQLNINIINYQKYLKELIKEKHTNTNLNNNELNNNVLNNNELNSNKLNNNELNNKVSNIFIRIGVDEVARGCLIGPVVSSSVVINDTKLLQLSENQIKKIPEIKDSKKLSSIKRKKAEDWIKNEGALYYGYGESNTEEIYNYNIRNATFLSMNRSILECLDKIKKDTNNINSNLNINNNIHLLIDGNAFKIMDEYKNDFSNYNLKIDTIIKGDDKELSIACASILAKEYRDNLINDLVKKDKSLEKYNWDKNKGYGTKDHFNKILKHGITIHHRLGFLNKMFKRENLN